MPWEQRLKSGMWDALTRCLSVYDSSITSTPVPAVNDYRPIILAQLGLVEALSTVR